MPEPGARRLALGVSYRGTAYHGWQSQPDGKTVQDRLEQALSKFAAAPVSTLCAGRTDAGRVNAQVCADCWKRIKQGSLPPTRPRCAPCYRSGNTVHKVGRYCHVCGSSEELT